MDYVAIFMHFPLIGPSESHSRYNDTLPKYPSKRIIWMSIFIFTKKRVSFFWFKSRKVDLCSKLNTLTNKLSNLNSRYYSWNSKSTGNKKKNEPSNCKSTQIMINYNESINFTANFCRILMQKSIFWNYHLFYRTTKIIGL